MLLYSSGLTSMEVPPSLLPCDDAARRLSLYVGLTLDSPASKTALYRILGIEPG
jgi:hypothetical protein